ncbi:MAG: hypothetical protein Q7S44_03270 [bacterium]|nr:hypothetical protein [bacterium]
MPARKIAKKSEELPLLEESSVLVSPKTPSKTDLFLNLIQEISQLQTKFEKLQKEISETQETWVLEQQNHQKEVEDRNRQEELSRKRDQEVYEYESARRRKQAEDEFADKKSAWIKELSEQQKAIEQDRKELEELRQVVAGFESEKEKAVASAQATLQKELTTNFETERKLREQEIKAEKELLNLRIQNLTTDNSHQVREIESLKKSLEEATRQIKEVAVKVIESGSNLPKTTNLVE